jgi:tRNA modification GTPase
MTASAATIFALSSGVVPAGIAIVRMSGPKVRGALETLIDSVPEPRRAHLTSIRGAEGTLIDRGLVLFFPGPASFTGEDVAELHVHGGRAVVSAVLGRLGGLPGFRPAEPGEFTRRAFVNGRLDLTEVEGLADLIRADTEAQRRQAVRQASGALKEVFEGWRARLVNARAMVEAELDFADEEDVSSILRMRRMFPVRYRISRGRRQPRSPRRSGCSSRTSIVESASVTARRWF